MIESNISMHLPNEIIFKRNDYSNSFFSVVEGELAALVEGNDGRETAFPIKAGNFFGEMGLLSGRSRTATIKAVTDCVLIETPRRPMLKLINSVASVKRKLDEVSLRRAILNCLSSALPESELDYLVRSATVRRYEAGEILFHQGDKADGLYLIRRGSVMISRLADGKEDVLAYVVAGNFVGEMALLSDKPRFATVRAAAMTEVVLLEASEVITVLERNKTMRETLAVRYREYVHDDKRVETHDKSDNLFTFLIQQGVGEATDVLLIDYSRCIRCNHCEEACADTHGGTSLLNRESGPTHGHMHVPVSCRHCEHPHCMKDCPPNAIHRSVNGEVFISDSCIGCGNCASNCPYDVIRLAAIDHEFKRPSLWQVLLGMDKSDKKSQAQNSDLPKQAIKCDMCKSNRTGPVCVRSCPTGAAMRVSPEVLAITLRENSLAKIH